MFERYTEKARRVIFFARYEASGFGAKAIEPEHLLLGLLRDEKAFVEDAGQLRLTLLSGLVGDEKISIARFFARAHTSLDVIRREIEERVPRGEKFSSSVELPLAVETKRVLHYAHEEAEGLQHRHIGTEHLLLGLLREEGTIAAQILFERGLRLTTVREEIARVTGSADPFGSLPTEPAES